MRCHYLLLFIFAIFFSNNFLVLADSHLTDESYFYDVRASKAPDHSRLFDLILAENHTAQTKQETPTNLIQQLNLTPKQRQQIEQIRRRYQQSIIQKKEALKLLQEELSQMMAGKDSVSSIRAKNQELVLLHQEIAELRFESMLATREILTLPQRQKFKQILESQKSDRDRIFGKK